MFEMVKKKVWEGRNFKNAMLFILFFTKILIVKINFFLTNLHFKTNLELYFKVV